jgi:uncharacterized protein YoxC
MMQALREELAEKVPVAAEELKRVSSAVADVSESVARAMSRTCGARCP